MFTKLKKILSNGEIIKKLIFTFLILLVFKIGTYIPIPMVDTLAIRAEIANNNFLTVLNAFSGGGLSNFSILALGISPYITSSIIVQMLQLVIPKFKEWSEQGEVGKQKLNRITRYVSIGLALAQGLALLFGLGANPENILVADVLKYQNMYWLFYIYMALVITAGSCFTMWLADLITRHGVGNGSSMIIAAGIISTIPAMFSTLINKYLGAAASTVNIICFVSIIVLYVLMIFGVVFFEGAKREIPVQYSNRQGNNKSNIPFKLNSASVIPVIFASTLLSIPLTIVGMLGQNTSTAGIWIEQIFSYQKPVGIIIYILLIFFFSFFYTFMTVDPEKLSENLDKQGAYIPGYRRGEKTINTIADLLFKTTIIGATYLTILALVPIVVSLSFGFTSQEASVITVGGTSLIIVVGVAIETAKQLETASETKEYKGFLN